MLKITEWMYRRVPFLRDTNFVDGLKVALKQLVETIQLHMLLTL